jgi:hypothetical protein
MVPWKAGRGGDHRRGVLTVYQMHVVKESKKISGIKPQRHINLIVSLDTWVVKGG